LLGFSASREIGEKLDRTRFYGLHRHRNVTVTMKMFGIRQFALQPG
jgi:hypothetical protein